MKFAIHDIATMSDLDIRRLTALGPEPWCDAKEPNRVYRCTKTAGHEDWHGCVKSDWPLDATEQNWPPCDGRPYP